METTTNTRLCKKCGVEKPLEEIARIKRDGKIYYRYCCRKCLTARCHELHPLSEKAPLYLLEKRTCVGCETEQPIENFPLYSNKKHRRARCRPCLREYKNQNRKKLPKGYRSEKERPSRLAYTEKHREEINEKSRKYGEQNRDKSAANTRRRRARIKAAVGEIDRDFIIRRDGNICYLCKKTLAKNQISIDHVIPIVSGGNNLPENLHVCCKACNRHKGINLISDLHNFPYFQKLGFVK